MWETIKVWFGNIFGFIPEFFGRLKDKVVYLVQILQTSRYSFLFLPLVFFGIGFVESVGVLGLFIPVDIISISLLALLIHNMSLFFLCVLLFALGTQTGFVVGYFLGKRYCSSFLCSLEDKYDSLKKYFADIDYYIDKYKVLAFPILVSLGPTRPLLGLHLGARGYDFRKYFVGTFLSTIFYTVLRAGVAYLVGIFGKIVLNYLKISYQYIVYAVAIFIVIYVIRDIYKGEEELKGEPKPSSKWEKKLTEKLEQKLDKSAKRKQKFQDTKQKFQDRKQKKKTDKISKPKNGKTNKN